MKILVIEDQGAIRDEVVEWLNFEGYEVFEAENGRVGVKIAHREIPDLILCDIAMPEMDGHEVLIEVRSTFALSHIPFIFLTAMTDRDSIRKGMEMGADDYITKPFSHQELLSAIQTRLQKKILQERQIQSYIDEFGVALEEERERSQLKTRLLGMFSHDFRNPLASILASADILKKYEERLSPDRKEEHFGRIQSAVQQLMQMLDDMLVLAEMESGHLRFIPQSMNLSAFIGGMITEFQLIDQNNHQFIFHTTLEANFEADSKLLRHILSNLLSNAIKYSPPDTTVTVKLFTNDEHICIEVIDEGVGIPEASLPHLFEPFHRADNVKDTKGTGLGLPIAMECVVHHQGTIEVETNLNRGSRFTVLLPKVIR